MYFSNDELQHLYAKMLEKPADETCSGDGETIMWLIKDLFQERERNARLREAKG